MPRKSKPDVQTVQVVVPFDPQRLSPNLRIHYRQRAERVQKAREAARLGWLQAGRPVFLEPALVSVTVRRSRKLDPDNALAACKAALDQLLSKRNNGCGMLPDDSGEWVTYAPIEQETGDRFRGKAAIVVTLTPRGG